MNTLMRVLSKMFIQTLSHSIQYCSISSHLLFLVMPSRLINANTSYRVVSYPILSGVLESHECGEGVESMREGAALERNRLPVQGTV